MSRIGLASACIGLLVLVGCVTQQVNKSFYEIQKGNYDRAEEILLDILADDPDHPYALLNLGYAYELEGRVEDARAQYRKVADMNLDEVPAKVTRSELEGLTLSEIAQRGLDGLPSS